MRELFNTGWEFCKKTENEKKGKYQKIEIPHDWLIYDTNNLYQNSTGFYKKEFTISHSDLEDLSQVFLRFEGIYQNWTAFINGKKVCEWKYGYTSVEFPITGFIKEGKNTVEVTVDYKSPNSRWYSGAGIFRDVYLVKTGFARIAPDGTYVYTQKNNKDCEWTLNIETELQIFGNNNKKLKIEHKLFDGDKIISFLNQSESEKSDKNIFSANLSDIMPWNLDNPKLYKIKTRLVDSDGKILDEISQNIGFRTIKINPDKGFFLNDRHIVIHGVCEHHDFGLFGAEFNLPSLKRKFKKLKAMGVNSIRSSHNPPAPALLDLADREGILICDEIFDMWQICKTKFDYGTLFDDWHERDCSIWIKRDRNHPCVIMWSIGNEIPDTNFESGVKITKELKKIVKRYDSYGNAFVTSASNYMGNEFPQKCASELELVGYNYAERLYNEHHKKNPSWCIYGSETASLFQSRGIYHFPIEARPLTHDDHQCSALGNSSASWGAKTAESTIRQDLETPYSAGQYIWTGFDYIGEPTPYTTKNSYFGMIDTAGFEKDTFYIYKAGWIDAKKEPFIHLFPYWDWNEGQKIDVRVATNGFAAELFVNGVSMGKISSTNNYPLITASWEGVEYHKGSIKAVSYDKDGKVIAEEEKKSFGDSEKIVWSIEDSSCDGFFFIDIHAIDKDGNDVENANDIVKITVKGKAQLIGADNGDSTDYDHYRSKDGKRITRRLFSGKLLAIVKAEKADDFEIEVQQSEDFTPIRKIEIIADEKLNFTKNKKTQLAKALIYPKNASEQELIWKAHMKRGVPSDCVKISGNTEEARLEAQSDGEFILSCFAKNGKKYPVLLGEKEGNVSGIGNCSKNPYQIIKASKCDESSSAIELCFGDGIRTKKQGGSFYFENIDFGLEGSDTLIVSIYSVKDAESFSVWEGKPEDGKKICDFHYKEKSQWEIYKTNSLILERRLFGKKNLTFCFNSELCFEGFTFEKSKKAFSKLNALDADTITGDSFTKTSSYVEKIGNNVTLTFENMNFEDNAATKLTICGNAEIDNRIELQFSDENESGRQTLYFNKSKGFEERCFEIKGMQKNQTVSFIFLPGSQFDFKWFRFE